MRRSRVPVCMSALFVLIWTCRSLPLAASDGVIEINQAKALAGGVIPGDNAGFPVSVGSGSYCLTGNLDLTFLGPGVAENTHAIEVIGNPSYVELDLNGFSIVGPTVCTASCAPTGIGSAVYSVSPEQYVHLHSGTIAGMGGYGAQLQRGNVEDVSFLNNGGNGLFHVYGMIKHCLALANGGVGIETIVGAVSESSSFVNLGDGIRARMVDSSISENNYGDGIEIGSGSVRESASGGNGGKPLNCISSCTLNGNRFFSCAGTGCFGGAGTRIQVPAASNSCGDAVCP